jgi:hypothetical protein
VFRTLFLLLLLMAGQGLFMADKCNSGTAASRCTTPEPMKFTISKYPQIPRWLICIPRYWMPTTTTDLRKRVRKRIRRSFEMLRAIVGKLPARARKGRKLDSSTRAAAFNIRTRTSQLTEHI